MNIYFLFFILITTVKLIYGQIAKDCNIVKSLFTKNIPDLREEYSECFSNPFSTKYYEIRSSGNNVEKM